MQCDIDCGSDAIHISNILNNCMPHTLESLNDTLNKPNMLELSEKNNLLSSFFLNVDGNSTNFNHLLAILKGINHSFSAIGVAETNTGPNSCSPYCIPNYTPFYQNTREGKQSGTGVALYIHNTFNATIIPEVSQCSTNIESLVIKVTNTEHPVYFGVVYRPNDGDKSLFYDELQQILDFLPDKGTFLMGDFNINLLNKIPNSDYEDIIYSSGYTPLISIVTHDRSSSKPSCIDNIFSNESQNVILTGTLLDNINHHLPVFQFSQSKCPESKVEKQLQFYDYNNKNVKKLY